MQRTVCGLSRLHYYSATRQCQSIFDTLSIRRGTQCRHLRHHKSPPEPFSSSTKFSRNVADSAGQILKDDSDLLSRSQPYGITSTLELDQESDFESKSRDRKCLIDAYPYRQDLTLWNVLLDYRVRHYGSKGAVTIWRGLKYRGPRVSLESEDDSTTSFWQKLLSCAAEYNDLRLTQRLCERGGIAWNRPKLFAETISTLLRAGRDFQVGVMCEQLKSKHQNGIVDVLELYNTYQPQHYDELKAFCTVYEKFRPGKMYAPGTSHLLTGKRPQDALLLHKFLISRGDFPTSFPEIEPLMKYLAKQSKDPGPFLRNLAASGAVFSGQGREVHAYESRQLVSGFDTKTTGRGLGSEVPWANKVSDSFAAKAFAAKAFSFEFVLNTLRAFGLREIGPQTIREIGLNAGGLDLMLERLAKLDDLGVDTGGSAYSRFIRKSCMARDDRLLSQALRTDMHHDVFEDDHLQKRLLVECLNKCAWGKVNLLLAMLSYGQSIDLTDSVKSSFLESVVQDDLKARSFLTLLSNLTGAKHKLPSKVSHDLTDRTILRLQDTKKKEKLSHKTYSRRARFTAGVLQGCTMVEARLTVWQWKTLIGQLGRSGALEEVHEVALWLATWYSEQVENLAFERQPAESTTTTLKHIFDGRFQSAVVHWALTHQFYKKSGYVRHPWQTTLALLRYLQDGCDVPIRLWVIRKTIVLFVRGLYSRSASALRTRRADSRKGESRRLCFKLFRSLDEYWPKTVVTTKSDQDVAVKYLLEHKTPRANEVALAARPSLRKAWRRFPTARCFASEGHNK